MQTESAEGTKRTKSVSRDYSDSDDEGESTDSEAETVIEEAEGSKQGGDPKSLKRLSRRIDSSASEEDEGTSKIYSEGSDHKRKNEVSHRRRKLSRHEHSRSASPSSFYSHAVPSKRKDATKVRDSSGRLLLQKLCDKGDYEGSKRLVQIGVDVNDRDYAGNTAIHDAALKGHYDIVELLLDNGAIIDIRSGIEDLDTPLIDATSRGHLDIVKLLLSRGADPRIFNAQGKNALDFLPEDANGDEIKRLLKEYSLKFRNKRRGSDTMSDSENDKALSYDSSRSIPGTFPSPDMPKRFTDQSSDKHTSGRRRGGVRAQSIRNDLLWMDLTTKTGREQVYKKAADGDIQYVGRSLEEGWQPDADCLVLAAKHGHTDLVGLLLAFGVSSDGLNEEGNTALHETVGRGHVDTIKLLLESGADPCRLDKQGRSYVDLAKEALGSDDEETVIISDAVASKNKKPQNLKGGSEVEPTTISNRISTSSTSNNRSTSTNTTMASQQHSSLERTSSAQSNSNLISDASKRKDGREKRHHNDNEPEHRLKKRRSEANIGKKELKTNHKLVERFSEKVGAVTSSSSRRTSLGDLLKGKQQQYMNRSEERSDKEKNKKEKGNDRSLSNFSFPSTLLGESFTHSNQSDENTISIKTEGRPTFPKIVDTKSLEGVYLGSLKAKANRKNEKKTDMEIPNTRIEKSSGHQNQFQMVSEASDKEKERDKLLERESIRNKRLKVESLEDERLENERLEKERLEKERLEKERLEKERLEKERLEKERLEKERLEKERLEKERLEKERLEKERLEKERLEKERLEKERLEKERLEKERLEKDRLEKERLEKERLEKERLEKEHYELQKIEEEKAKAMAEKAKEEERQRLRELAHKRELLEAQKERERKERERKMLLNLEAEEKRKQEKKKIQEEEEQVRFKKLQEEEEKKKAYEMEQELERRRSLQRQRDAELLRNYPYAVRMANYGRNTLEEMRKFFPLLGRTFGSSESGLASYHFLDVQVYLTLGMPNIHQLYPELTKKLVTGQEKEKIWSMLTPWLCRPLNPFEDVLLKDILAERDADKAKFMNMTVFWLRATEVGEVFKAEASDLFQIYSNNIVRIDLDFKAENEPVVVPQNAKSRVNEALTKHKSLPLKLRMKIRALNEPIKW